MGPLAQMLKKAKPYLLAVLLQLGFAGISIIGKFALNQGLSQHVFAVYRNAVATVIIAPFALVFDRNTRPKMTLSILTKIMLLGLLEPVINQNLYYTGMKYTTATFTAALFNVLPAFAFLMAWGLKLEKVNIRRLHSQAKLLGTVVTVGGAMMMTLLRGPMLNLPWTRSGTSQDTSSASDDHKIILGALMITIGCLCWSAFITLQALTLKSYPAELSLTAWICLVGSVEGTVLALILERHNPSAWSIHLDSKFLAVLYGGIVCSGMAYYVQGLIMKEKGPVFVSAFSPLNLVLVAIMASFILAEKIYVGRVVGAIVIVTGLYMVLWGKSKEQDTPSLSKCTNCSQMNSNLKAEPLDNSV